MNTISQNTGLHAQCQDNDHHIQQKGSTDVKLLCRNSSTLNAFYFLAQNSMRRLIPLTCLQAKYEARTRRQLA